MRSGTSIGSLQDFHLPLKELKAIVEDLIQQHGEDTIIYTDAGYNNVSFYLEDEE